MEGSLQCAANYVPLSPISFLERAVFVHGGKTSIVYGSTRFTWKQTHERCLKLACALTRLDISRGDIVAAMAPNIPALYELQFAVPMAGAVLSALNPRLDKPTLSCLLHQLQPKIVFVDSEYLQIISEAILTTSLNEPPLLITIHDRSPPQPPQEHVELSRESQDYDMFLASVMEEDGEFEIMRPVSECDPISINFTSGSTGTPKGVVYSHRAAYLNSLGVILQGEMTTGNVPVFLWTVDMFRCNGWCFAWAMAAIGGVNVCLRSVTAGTIFDSIRLHSVTHLCGKPKILNMLAESPPSMRDQKPLTSKVKVVIAGAFPPTHVVQKVKDLGFEVTYGYGMTEALGPAVTIPWRPTSPETHHSSSMDDDHKDRQTPRCGKEGLHGLMLEGVDVKDPITMKSVPSDGATIGEVMMRGNTLMTGYFKNPTATRKAFDGGWFRTGDVGVRHVDGCIEMKDRAEDGIITRGGELVSSLDVEAVLLRHPKVSDAAVVARDDGVLGQVPCAFVKLKDGCCSSAEEIREFCAGCMPPIMVPEMVWFGDLPVNSTGKVQKFVLRGRTNSSTASVNKTI